MPARAHIEARAAAPCLRPEVACGARPHSQATAFYFSLRCTSSPASIKPLTAADLPFTALIERSIASTLSRHADNLNSSLSDLEQQDLVLCEYLQALLAPHGRHLHASSPTRTSTRIVPPACAPSVLFSWSESVDTTSLPLSTPTPPPALRFLTTTRARSSARGSASGNGAALEMSALVARLRLRRREGKGQTGAGTKRAFVPRASRPASRASLYPPTYWIVMSS
ncbi:hypothetical protein B0H14DRAFT_3548194 [Mycena olivaceomarginata]|nr:hypothetical protein B0H14DRAFT_3548194 [Mycena olivaceomarginata]